jgi:hypothetical protein
VVKQFFAWCSMAVGEVFNLVGSHEKHAADGKDSAESRVADTFYPLNASG